MRTAIPISTVVFATIAALGCGPPSATVSGVVLIDGEQASGGLVTFHPVGGGPLVVGRIADDGSYSLRLGQGALSADQASRVPVGEYQVTVVVASPPTPGGQPSEADSAPPEPEASAAEGDEEKGDEGDDEAVDRPDRSDNVGPAAAGPRLMDAKYGSKETSGLSKTVKPGPNVINFELDRAASPEASAADDATATDEASESPANEPAGSAPGPAIEAAEADEEQPADSTESGDQGGQS